MFFLNTHTLGFRPHIRAGVATRVYRNQDNTVQYERARAAQITVFSRHDNGYHIWIGARLHKDTLPPTRPYEKIVPHIVNYSPASIDPHSLGTALVAVLYFSKTLHSMAFVAPHCRTGYRTIVMNSE